MNLVICLSVRVKPTRLLGAELPHILLRVGLRVQQVASLKAIQRMQHHHQQQRQQQQKITTTTSTTTATTTTTTITTTTITNTINININLIPPTVSLNQLDELGDLSVGVELCGEPTRLLGAVLPHILLRVGLRVQHVARLEAVGRGGVGGAARALGGVVRGGGGARGRRGRVQQAGFSRDKTE